MEQHPAERSWSAVVARSVFPAMLTLVLFASAIYVVMLPALREDLLEGKRETIRELTATVHELLQDYDRRVQAGEFTLEEAQARAVARIRALRYGPENKDYFWINDLQPRIIMHPYRTDLEGQDVSDFTDPKGKRLFWEFAQVARATGEGYVDYMWQWKDESDRIVPKLSYVRLFEPWDWVVGTGIYLDDVENAIASIARRLTRVLAGILAIVALTLGYIVWQGTRVEFRRARAESALRESEQRLSDIIEFLPDATFVVDRAGRVTAWNRAIEELTGISSADMIGKGDYEYALPFYAERRPVLVDLVLHPDQQMEGQYSLFTREENRVTGVVKIRMTDSEGRPRHVSASASRLLNAKGEATGAIEILRDVTEQWETHREMQRLATAIDRAGEAVLITNKDGVTEYVSPAFERITGYTRDEMLGRKPRILRAEEHDEAVFKDLWGAVSSGRIWSGRFSTQRKDESQLILDAVVSPVVAESGEILSYVVVERDVTQEVRLESQLHQAQRMESVGRLAAGVAHDLNNLLSPVLGYVELMLLDLAPEDPQREDLLEIQGAAERAKVLIRQLLALGRRQALVMRTLNLNDVVTGFFNMLRHTIREDITIETALAPALGNIRADAGQLEQILMNLAVNAQDAMPDGGAIAMRTADVILDQAYAGTQSDVEPGPHVMLAFSDTGAGMSGDTLERLFEPFFTTKEPGKGTGLGLATVYGIVKQHKGNIWVYSEISRGTTFKIYFPRVDADVEDRSVRKEAPVLAGGTETIMVVEDSPGVRRIVCSILRKHGYSVLEATDGADCLERLEGCETTPDLFVTDIIMPRMSGRELYEHLSERYSGLRILFMSGYADEVIPADGHGGARVDFLDKPVSAQALATKVRNLLDH